MPGWRWALASINLYVDNPDPASSIRAIADNPPDILAVQEFTPHAQTAMDTQLGLDQYPHRIEVPVDGTVGQAIYSRFPMTRVDAAETAPDTLTADVEVPGSGPSASSTSTRSAHRPANQALPPLVLIDHALLSGDLLATGTRERTIRGADHRLIEIDLDL